MYKRIATRHSPYSQYILFEEDALDGYFGRNYLWYKFFGGKAFMKFFKNRLEDHMKKKRSIK